MMNRMHDRGRAALFSSAAILAFAFASRAVAQGAQPPAAASQQAAKSQNGNGDQQGGETIIVTGTKRPQVLLDVPQSITVVTGQALEAQHANSFEDYLKLV